MSTRRSITAFERSESYWVVATLVLTIVARLVLLAERQAIVSLANVAEDRRCPRSSCEAS
jgi:hypothetical protein